MRKLKITTSVGSWCVCVLRCRYTLSAAVFRREIAEIGLKMIAVMFGANSYVHRRFQGMVAPLTLTAHSMNIEQTVATRRRSQSS